ECDARQYIDIIVFVVYLTQKLFLILYIVSRVVNFGIFHTCADNHRCPFGKILIPANISRRHQFFCMIVFSEIFRRRSILLDYGGAMQVYATYVLFVYTPARRVLPTWRTIAA